MQVTSSLLPNRIGSTYGDGRTVQNARERAHSLDHKTEEKLDSKGTLDPSIIDMTARFEVVILDMSQLEQKINEYFLNLCKQTSIDPDSFLGQGLRNYFSDTVKKYHKKGNPVLQSHTFKNDNVARVEAFKLARTALPKLNKELSNTPILKPYILEILSNIKLCLAFSWVA